MSPCKNHGPQVDAQHDALIPGQGIEIRAPKPEDLDALVTIDASWSKQRRRSYLEGRLRRAMRPAGVSLARVAEHDGKVVGFLLGEATWGEFGRIGGVAWIDTIGVEREHVREGVGRALLQDFMLHADKLGVESIRTLLEPENDDLTEFLQENGFGVARTRVVEKRLLGEEPR